MKIRFKKPRLPARRGSPGPMPKPKKESVIAPGAPNRPYPLVLRHGFLTALDHPMLYVMYVHNNEYPSRECPTCQKGRCIKRIDATSSEMLGIAHNVEKELN